MDPIGKNQNGSCGFPICFWICYSFTCVSTMASTCYSQKIHQFNNEFQVNMKQFFLILLFVLFLNIFYLFAILNAEIFFPFSRDTHILTKYHERLFGMTRQFIL